MAVLLLQGEVTIHYNKLQADPKQGMSLDIGKPGQSSHVPWALAFSVQAGRMAGSSHSQAPGPAFSLPCVLHLPLPDFGLCVMAPPVVYF